MKTIVLLVISFLTFSTSSLSQKKEFEFVDGLRVMHTEPGFVVGMDEQFNYVFLNTVTFKKVTLFEYAMEPDALLTDKEQLTLIVQNGNFYASVSSFDPNDIKPEIYTDEQLASNAIVKYSIEYLRLRTSD